MLLPPPDHDGFEAIEVANASPNEITGNIITVIDMKPIWRKMLGPGLSLNLFAVAAWLLHKELRAYHLRDMLHAFDTISGAYLWAASGLTMLSYAVMTGYDVLAMRYIRQPMSYSKIGLASFIGYAFSNNIGMSMIAGTSVRYRLYSAWGLSTLQITQGGDVWNRISG